MKLNNEDKRRLIETIEAVNCYGVSFDEWAVRYSVQAARKIRGTFNRLQRAAQEYGIDKFDVVEYVKGNIYNSSTLLLFLLMRFRGVQMRSVDLTRHIYDETGEWYSSDELKPMLFRIDCMTQCDPVSYSDTYGIDCLTIK